MKEPQACAAAAGENAVEPREFDLIFRAAVAAAAGPYPVLLMQRANFWDDVISSFARAHGADLAAKVFGVEIETVIALLRHPTASSFPRCVSSRSAP